MRAWVLDAVPSGWDLLENGRNVTATPFDCSDADARLISAAPQLLQACKYLLANAEAEGFSEFMLRDARAAIAAAGQEV